MLRGKDTAASGGGNSMQRQKEGTQRLLFVQLGKRKETSKKQWR